LKRVADLPPRLLQDLLAGPGLRVRTGPVVMSIRSSVPEVITGVALLYAEHPCTADDEMADFHVGVSRTGGWRRWVGPQVSFVLDGTRPFNALPGNQGFPLLEWGMNWCISGLAPQYLTLHAAVLERHGRALLLPAPSGSGKSTLCAALMNRGWRLLSDELAVIDPSTAKVLPIPRPVSLKNASIGLIRQFAPDTVFGRTVTETLKGDVAHIKPPAEAVRRADEAAPPGWVVIPRFERGAPAQLSPMGKCAALMRLIENAFNYNIHGRAGFEALARIVESSNCHVLTYDALDDGVQCLERLSAGACATAHEV
jgi:HprK-related kinase A